MLYGIALCLVGIEQAGGGVATQHERQFPGKVQGVLHTCVHALCAGRAVDVRRIPGEEYAPFPQSRREATVHLEEGRPPQIGEGHLDRCALCHHLLELR